MSHSGSVTICTMNDTTHTNSLDIFIEDRIYKLNVPDTIFRDASDFFRKMDRDMDQGWQMGTRYIENPDVVMRAQIAAAKLMVAVETDNTTLANLMAGYIISRLPGTTGVRIDTQGDMLGTEREGFWRDHKSSKVNGIRTRSLIEKCDIAVVRFGDKYKQWNAAFDAGICAALGKPYITLHDESIIHPLKEVDAAAMAWAQTPEQVVETLKYVISA